MKWAGLCFDRHALRTALTNPGFDSVLVSDVPVSGGVVAEPEAARR